MKEEIAEKEIKEEVTATKEQLAGTKNTDGASETVADVAQSAPADNLDDGEKNVVNTSLNTAEGLEAVAGEEGTAALADDSQDSSLAANVSVDAAEADIQKDAPDTGHVSEAAIETGKTDVDVNETVANVEENVVASLSNGEKLDMSAASDLPNNTDSVSEPSDVTESKNDDSALETTVTSSDCLTDGSEAQSDVSSAVL
jgi:hypothetical protein